MRTPVVGDARLVCPRRWCVQVAREHGKPAFSTQDHASLVEVVNHTAAAFARSTAAVEAQRRLMRVMQELGAAPTHAADAETAVRATAERVETTLTHTRDVLSSLSAAGLDRTSLFKRAAVAVCDAVGAQFGQLFTLEAVPLPSSGSSSAPATPARRRSDDADDGPPEAQLSLTAFDLRSQGLVHLELASLPAGHAVLDGRPHAFELHSDEFWSADLLLHTAKTGAVARGRFSVLCVSVLNAAGHVVAVLQAARRHSGGGVDSDDDSERDASVFARRDVVTLEVVAAQVATMLECSSVLLSLAQDNESVSGTAQDWATAVAEHRENQHRMQMLCGLAEQLGAAASVLEVCES